MKSLIGGGALISAALFTGSFLLPAPPLVAETLLGQVKDQAHATSNTRHPAGTGDEQRERVVTTQLASHSDSGSSFQRRPAAYVATAYALKGRTASGRYVGRGIIAADPRVLPLGSTVRLEAGQWSGQYTVADTGGAVRGKRIDVWTPTTGEARRFGRRTVKLTVLSWGPKKKG